MLSTVGRWFTFLFIAFVVNAAYAVPNVPKIKATSYILMDYDSEQVIAYFRADERVEPASLTKMMSVYVVAEAIRLGKIKLTDMVKISQRAWRMKGSRMFLEEGSEVGVEDLLKGMIVQSGNDATIALAEYVGGDEAGFVVMMNAQAKALGLQDTHFVNATGLPNPEHYSTVRDLATLAKALIHDHPDQYKWYSIKSFKHNKIKQDNRNRLLWKDEAVDGIKTGHTESAGYCLVASAKRDNMRLISVVVGTDSDKARAAESWKLLEYGYNHYETHHLYTANQTLTKAHIWKGEVEELPLGITEDLYVTIPKGEYKTLQASVSVTAQIVAPAKKGDAYGTLNIILGDKNYAVRKLIATEEVNAGDWNRKFIDSIRMMLE